MSLMEVRHLFQWFHKGFLGKKKDPALYDVNFVLEKGETLGLAGTSGAGKSTLARAVMQLLPVSEGEVFFHGDNLCALRPAEMKKKRRTMQMLFQNPMASLNPRMTIEESMKEPLLLYHMEGKLPLISRYMDRFSLREELLPRMPSELSGGELQRICLARLLLVEPELLILDEPTSMLDVSVQAEIVEELLAIQKERGLSYLFISHDLDLLRCACHRIGIMKEGRLLEIQETETLFNAPENGYTRDLIEEFRTF